MEEGLFLATTLRGGSQGSEYSDLPLCHSLLWLNLTRSKRIREIFSGVHSPGQLLKVPAVGGRLGRDLQRRQEALGQDKESVPGHPSSPLHSFMS